MDYLSRTINRKALRLATIPKMCDRSWSKDWLRYWASAKYNPRIGKPLRYYPVWTIDSKETSTIFNTTDVHTILSVSLRNTLI